MTIGCEKQDQFVNGVSLHPLKKINVEGGDVFQCLKKSDNFYNKFGEAYFSFIEKNFVKAWKLHNSMTVNLVVPCGSVKFVIVDKRNFSKSYGQINSVVLSPENYCLLKISPGLWFGFQGIGDNKNVILNIADIEHDPLEQKRAPIEYLSYDWKSSEETSL